MLGVEDWGMIRRLKNSGLNISEISKKLNIDRKTVRKQLDQNSSKSYKRKKSETKLDPYADYIDQRLEKYCLTAKKIFKEIKEQGFNGKYVIVSRYVKKIKDKHRAKAVLLFETLPGEQAQVDWGYFGTIYDEDLKKDVRLCCFLMILGYSRTKFIYFFDCDNTENFLSGHNKAFEYFGGYTKDILYDNLKSVVIKRAFRASDSDFNKRFLEFSGFYGYTPILARPYKPQTKGKVENTVKYVRSSFFNGEHFSSLKDINQKALNWLNEVNNEVHSTIKVKPFERLRLENLLKINGKFFDLSQVYYRKVFIDSHLNLFAKKYSVPYEYVNKEVAITVNDDNISIFYREKIIANHVRDYSSKLYITNPDHLDGLAEKRYASSYRPKEKLIKSNEDSINTIIDNKDFYVEVESRDLNIYQGVIE
jgi:transposase